MLMLTEAVANCRVSGRKIAHTQMTKITRNSAALLASGTATSLGCRRSTIWRPSSNGCSTLSGWSATACTMQDYGAPVGLRLAVNYPQRVRALIFQNGNVYEEGLRPDFWASSRALWQSRTPETEAPLRAVLALPTAQFLFGFGMRDAGAIRLEVLEDTGQLLGNPERHAALLNLFDDYRSNVEQYPAWRAYLRHHQPPTLVVWGQNDPVFAPEGVLAFRRDLPPAEVHLLDSGHFALEEEADMIAVLLHRFLTRHGEDNR